jgi:transcriptional regulator with XRE-family HTH domain
VAKADDLALVFGRVLRERRLAAGLSQEKLALEADVDRTFVSLLERGGRQPTLSTLWRLAGALGVPPSELLAGVEKARRTVRR